MIVRKILEGKRIHDIISVKSDDTVASAAGLLAEKRIGAVLVRDTDKDLAGILSERDIVRALGKRGAECMTEPVRTLMTKDLSVCQPHETANSVLERMSEGRFRHMPVIDGDMLVGVISIGDVVQARISEIQEENTALTGMIANTW